MFLRYVVPWRLLLWIDSRYEVCWANVVSWKLGRETEEWNPTWICFDGGRDYCGKFDQPPARREDG